MLQDIPYSDMNGFKDAMRLAWAWISPELCNTLVESMHRRLEKVISNDGGNTKY